MTMQTTANGVNIDRLVETINLVEATPELAQFEFRTKTQWTGGARSTTTIDAFYGAGSEQQHGRTHTLAGDEPEVLLGDDTAPNTVETVFAALASCLAGGYAYNAAAQGIELEDLSFELDGKLN